VAILTRTIRRGFALYAANVGVSGTFCYQFMAQHVPGRLGDLVTLTYEVINGLMILVGGGVCCLFFLYISVSTGFEL